MSRKLIDAEKLKAHYAWWEDDERRTLFDQIVDAQPTIDAEPVRHGKWIFESICGHAVMTCSECLKVQSGQTLCFTYCPNCGARMEGGRNEPTKRL